MPVAVRFSKLIEWIQEEGLEVLLFSFIHIRFDKCSLDELSDCEKLVTYAHLRTAVFTTRINRKSDYGKYN